MRAKQRQKRKAVSCLKKKVQRESERCGVREGVKVEKGRQSERSWTEREARWTNDCAPD